MLENFRAQKIIWDRANRKIFETIEANSGDSNGRKLVVQVINQEVTEVLSGTTLSLGWKSRNGAKGLDSFNLVDASKGVFEIYYTTEMLSNIGNLEASLILIDSTGRIESSTFTISVRPSTVDDESIESENSFTALTEALVKVNDFDAKLAQKANQADVRLRSVDIETTDLSETVIQQMAGNTPVNSVPENKSVTQYKVPEKAINDYHLNFIKTGKNLFNKELVFKNTYIATSGNIETLNGYATSIDIPIKAGNAYIIQKARYIATYDNSLTLIDRVDQGAYGATLLKTPAVDGYLRITTFDGISGKYYLDSVQIEQNSVETSYEPYSIDLTSNTKVAAEKVIGQFTKEQMDFINTGKNMFDVSKITVGGYLADANGAWYDYASYNTSDYIPVTAGRTYYVNICNKFIIYNKSKGFISGVNVPSAPYTFTATEDGFVRISYQNTFTNLQFEEGSVGTEYEPFKLLIPNLDTTSVNTKPLTVIKQGENVTISSVLKNGDSVQIQTIKNGSKNGAFQFNGTYINGDLVHQTTDDIAPIRTFATVGGNHGYTQTKVTLVNHDKTTADLGSQWTDGTSIYTLLDIAGNDLKFAIEYVVADDIASAKKATMGTSLTHVFGATNTSTIDASTQSNEQMYPSINNVSVDYVVDGFEIVEDGTYYGEELQVQESYNVMDYKGIIDFAQSNIGTSYNNDNVIGVVKLSNNYTFTEGGNCLLSSSIKALKKVFLGECGFTQSVALGSAGHTLQRYMPNVLAKNGYDFKNIQDMTDYNTTTTFGVADLADPTIPPNRYVDWLFNGSEKKYGYSMGYIIDKTNSKNSDRLSNIDGYFWGMRSTKKSYPVALFNKTLNAGDYETFLGYRNYLSPTTETNLNVVKDKKDAYIFIDSHENLTGGNVKLNEYIGKSIAVIDSENFTLLNDIVDAEGVTFSINNNYGYAILKVS